MTEIEQKVNRNHGFSMVKVVTEGLQKLLLSTWNPSGDLYAAEYAPSRNDFYPICKNKFNKQARCRIEKGVKGPCQDCPSKMYVPLTLELVKRHISGGARIGVYPLRGDVIFWCAADLDGHKESQDPHSDVRKFIEICTALDIPLFTFSSNSGNGFHCYLFFNALIPAFKARALMLELLERAGVDTRPRAGSFDAIFPKQDRLEDGDMGNLIALPYNGRAIAERNATLLLDQNLEPYPDNFDIFSERLTLMSEADVDGILKEMGVDPENKQSSAKELPSDTGGIRWDGKVRSLPVNDKIKTIILEPPEAGDRSEEEMSVLNALARAGLSNSQMLHIFRNHPIGIRFRERGENERWLHAQIGKARAYVNSWNKDSDGSSNPSEEEPNIKIRNWPELPNKALFGISGAFVELATRNSEGDPAAVLVTFLCRFGCEVGNGPHLMVGDTAHYARVNAIITGNSSKARKGTSGKPASRLFRFDAQEYGVDSPLLYIPATETPGPLSSGEGLIFAVRDAVTVWQVDKKTGEGQYVTVDPGIEDKRLFVLDEELASALKCTKREGNTLSTVIRSAYDNGKLAPLTKTNRITATGAHIVIVSHITTAELHRLLDETEALNGFANRFLWICARRQKLVPLPEPMPKSELARIQGELLKILDFSRRVGRVELNYEAKEMWVEIYPEISQEHPGLVGCVVNRAEAMVLRLALIYALLDSKAAIHTEHLEAALAMWAYAKESAEYIFHGREANPIAQKILDAIEKGPVSFTDAHKLFSNNATRLQIQTAVQELVSSGKVEVVDVKTDGRPKKVICLTKKTKKGSDSVSGEGVNSFSSFNSSSKCDLADDVEVF